MMQSAPEAEDPYRWAQALTSQGLSRDEAIARMVAGGIEAPLATETVDAIERHRPRPRPFRMIFGALMMVLGVGVLLLGYFKSGAVLLAGGLLSVWDGFHGKR